MRRGYGRHGSASNRLAIAASVGLHGAAAFALLAPWTSPPMATVPPMIVSLVVPPEVPPTPAPEPKPVQTISTPAPRPQPVRTKTVAPAPPISVPAEEAAGSGNPSEAAAAPSETAGGGNTSSPPGYALGTALTPAPDYPWSARRRGIEGRVVIRLDVDGDGRPTRVDLLHSSGDSALDQAALATLRLWRLRPALADGVPATGHIVVPIVFKLT